LATVDRPRSGALPWDQLRYRIDEHLPFTTMRGTPYYHDAVYEQFSPAEYARRYAALRHKMRDLNLDVAIVPGGPNHWSFGGGMMWLTGHWEWHAVANYVVVPLEGEPTLVYSMGGTHIEAVRREVAAALTDVRHSRGGRFGEVMVERITELGLERGRIGLIEIDARFGLFLYHLGNRLTDPCRQCGAVDRHAFFLGEHGPDQIIRPRQAAGVGR